MTKPAPCPCGGTDYATCCGPILAGTPAASAEQLMRSRYTAYTRHDDAYIAATWAARTRPAALEVADDSTKWLGLEIRHTSTDGDTAIVEFIARYKINGRAQRLHEVSRFVREQGYWFYVDGSFPESTRTP
ncbi:YchJ family protein [Actimicrobium sp. CCI2.3]|uniref:YchJ family protein n=1 Tax=Actimicrobium sp. CCI2.3 TaxID=3048616 RepID=UPI002AB4F120|nr:YchJ family metal-binding protein [Actimicrobium sp. CCI2.3]MDY7573218.1 YchJ family metal-binding protein [Actimicrobium sp. CCI2.3]MEB0022197.1 YchJ family metal-binding protein [Actimicrobium sp. CCI2.3]